MNIDISRYNENKMPEQYKAKVVEAQQMAFGWLLQNRRKMRNLKNDTLDCFLAVNNILLTAMQ